jgi:hypothetical protein
MSLLEVDTFFVFIRIEALPEPIIWLRQFKSALKELLDDADDIHVEDNESE